MFSELRLLTGRRGEGMRVAERLAAVHLPASPRARPSCASSEATIASPQRAQLSCPSILPSPGCQTGIRASSSQHEHLEHTSAV